MKAAARGVEARSAVRGDIQGLRAVAVGIVIAYHLLGRPAGGFVGVDVFFVISGFLIGGGLLRSAVSHGRLDLASFYWRRFWRLAPASVAVLGVTVTASYALMSKESARGIGLDSLWALGLSANWRFAEQGVQYSNASAADSPLLHFWSLAVEEQFYLVAPLAVLALIPLLRGRRRPWLVATWATVAFVLVAFLVSAWSTSVQPAIAYFGTHARAWELGIGVLLAAVMRVAPVIPGRLRKLAALVGLGLIGASSIVVDSASAFPVPWAIPAVLGAALVIAAGEGGPSTRVLENRFARYVGDRSYSLYLWHFPVRVFIDTFQIESRWLSVGIALALTFGTAELSYALIENPLRALGRRGSVVRARPFKASWLTGGAILGLLGGVGGLVGWVAWRPAPALADIDVQEVWAAPVGPAEQARLDAIGRALESDTWLDRTATVESAAHGYEWDNCFMPWGGARAADYVKSGICGWGDPDAPMVIYVVGDSTAISITPAVKEAYPDAYIRALTPGQCPIWEVTVRSWTRDDEPTDCSETREVILSTLEAAHPDLVVVTSAVSTLRRLESGATGDAAMSEWTDAMSATLPRLAAAAATVVILDAPPTASRAVSECTWRFSSPSDCFYSYSQADAEFARAQRTVVDHAALANVAYPQVAQWFCDERGRCPAVIDDVAVLVDTGHLGHEGSTRLGQLLAERVPLARFTTVPVPTVSGTATVGSTFEADAGTWAPTPASVTYQWYRDGEKIPGAVSPQYTLAVPDAGHEVSVTVTAKKAWFWSWGADSMPASVPWMTFATAPTPTISGDAAPGSVVTASVGAWSPTPDSVTYQWFRDGVEISGAVSDTYTLTSSDAGRQVSVVATAKKAGHKSAAAASPRINIANE